MGPVGDAEASAVGKVALVGAPPGDGGPGATADLTPEADALAAVTGHVGQRHQELWGNWGGGVGFERRPLKKTVLTHESNVGVLPS